MKRYLLIVSVFCFNAMLAQTSSQKPADLVKTFKENNDLPKVELLKPSVNRTNSMFQSELSSYELLDLNGEEINDLFNLRSSGLALDLVLDQELLELELVEVNPLAEEFTVMEMPSGILHTLTDKELGLHYRGVVKGKKGSIVSLSVFENEITALISWPAMIGNIVLGKTENASQHILYKDNDIADEFDFTCHADTDGEVLNHLGEELNQTRFTTRCPKIYFDVSKEIHDGKGGVSGASSYMLSLFDQVTLLYSLDNINIQLAGITVWTSTEPFGTLGAYETYRENNSVPGDLHAYINYSYSGGVAYLNGLCQSYGYSVSGIESSFSNIPTYSWSVMVLSHELGHNMGSQHTHACAWNGNNTAIDGCGANAGYSEGCSGSDPAAGGTIMSYCHLRSVGINLSLGFGPQPAARIASYVEASSCVTSCAAPTCTDGYQNGDETGVDCGGPTCPVCPTCDDGILNGNEIEIDCGGSDCAPCPCTGESVTLNLLFDNYPEETSWNITDANGGEIAAGGTYGNQADGSTLDIEVCVNAGCYTLTVYDSYGDGMCCGFGSGSYTLTSSTGAILASGGSFASSEATPFCIEGSTGCESPNTLNVEEIGFGTTNPRVNATWINPESTSYCEVRGGRISNSSYDAGEPEFTNIANTQVINQTNGSTVNFNIGLYNNPNIPFVVGQRYGFDVRCSCADGSGMSAWANMTPGATFVVPAPPVGLVLGTNKLLVAGVNSMSVYPNPTEGIFNIQLELTEEGSVQLILQNTLGQTVAQVRASGTSMTQHMDVSELDAGMYMLSVRTSAGVITERLIVK